MLIKSMKVSPKVSFDCLNYYERNAGPQLPRGFSEIPRAHQSAKHSSGEGSLIYTLFCVDLELQPDGSVGVHGPETSFGL